MSRTLSFRDLMVCEELAHIPNEISLLHPSNDELVSRILSKIGFDVEYPVVYSVSNHRDMQNKVAVGFMAIGEITLNRSFINSNLCSMTERRIAAAYLDPSLCRELNTLSGNHVNYRKLLAEEAEFDSDDLPEDMLEPDREQVGAHIRQLEDIRDAIRGPMYNDAGDLKTFSEYQNA